MVWFVDVFVRQ